MAAFLARPDRSGFTDVDVFQGKVSAAEAAEAFLSFGAYCGTYDVDEDQRIVHHHVIDHSCPGSSGTRFDRRYELIDGQLHLEPTDGSLGRLIWERAGEGDE